jgi:hypothetical protein
VQISRRGAIAAALAVAIGCAGCGEQERTIEQAATSPRVALSIDYPGYAPWALIVFRDERNRRCHALGAITKQGPRALERTDIPLADGLIRSGRCVERDDLDVSLQMRRPGKGGPRVVGGLARDGVRRVRIAGRTVRPRRDGSFLLVLPAGADRVGRTVGLEYGGGHRRKLPLGDVES